MPLSQGTVLFHLFSTLFSKLLFLTSVKTSTSLVNKRKSFSSNITQRREVDARRREFVKSLGQRTGREQDELLPNRRGKRSLSPSRLQSLTSSITGFEVSDFCSEPSVTANRAFTILSNKSFSSSRFAMSSYGVQDWSCSSL